MKIWGDIPKIFGVYNKNRNIERVQKTKSVASKSDELSISGEAKDFQTVMRERRKIPDVREDKVKDFSEKYDSGEYKVETKDLTEKIFKMMSKKA